MNDLINNDIEQYLVQMKKMIKDGCRVIPKIKRDKNFLFMYLYNITEKSIKEILLSLEINDYYNRFKSDNEKHKDELLYVWSPTRMLVDQNGEEREIKMYIKTYVDKKNNYVVVISFHKFGDY